MRISAAAEPEEDEPEQPIFYNQYIREAASPAGYITEALTGVPIDEQDDIGLPGYTGSLYWTCSGPGCWNGGNPQPPTTSLFGGPVGALTNGVLGGGGGVSGPTGFSAPTGGGTPGGGTPGGGALGGTAPGGGGAPGGGAPGGGAPGGGAPGGGESGLQ
ncbi:hypothetical protein QGN32_16865 [Mycolicibacterium sp. ND9-15]|uniref:hypothetical protein n=1 Tax=Mycolicibacterium sp. ND9-15 TaxID=3042320 RepID=UPI002DD94EC4|nr:hypothetical protein [Mycolicibacterium sp. ND9-15]WSE55111.1 hypothetical protein QGN32_16865 [Mycolicibacterium sp. ND9-15]